MASTTSPSKVSSHSTGFRSFIIEKVVIPPTIIMSSMATIGAMYAVWPSQRCLQAVYPYHIVVGLAAGLSIGKMAFQEKRKFQDAGTSLMSRKSNMLHTDGRFRYRRNPMYVGMLSMVLGMAVAFPTKIGFLLPILDYLLLAWIWVPWEEEMMEKEFGDAYREYKRRVPRWGICGF